MLAEANTEQVLELINKWWMGEDIPVELTRAEVVSLLKKVASQIVPHNCISLPSAQDDSVHTCINTSVAVSTPLMALYRRRRAAMHLGLML